MQFDDFEYLEEVPEKETKSGLQQKNASSNAFNIGGGLGVEDFEDFQAGAKDPDDDQSSVFTEDIIDLRKNQEEEEIDDFEGGEIWESYIPGMNQQNDNQQTKKDEQPKHKTGLGGQLNLFYEGVKENYLFDAFHFDNERKSKGENHEEENSEPKLNESIKLSEREPSHKEIEEDMNQAKVEIQPINKQENAPKMQNFEPEKNDHQINNEEHETKEDKNLKDAQERKIVNSSSGTKNISQQASLSQQQIQQHETKNHDMRLRHESTQEPKKNQNIDGEQKKQYEEPPEQGIQESDFKSFVDLDNDESQDDSRFEESIGGENEDNRQQIVNKNEDKTQNDPWLDNIFDAGPTGSSQPSVMQKTSHIQEDLLSFDNEQTLPAKKVIKSEYNTSVTHINSNQKENGINQIKRPDEYTQQSLKNDETREEDLWKSQGYGESLFNSHQPQIQSASVGGKFARSDFNLTGSPTNDYSLDKEYDFLQEDPSNSIYANRNRILPIPNRNDQQNNNIWDEIMEGPKDNKKLPDLFQKSAPLNKVNSSIMLMRDNTKQEVIQDIRNGGQNEKSIVKPDNKHNQPTTTKQQVNEEYLDKTEKNYKIDSVQSKSVQILQKPSEFLGDQQVRPNEKSNVQNLVKVQSVQLGDSQINFKKQNNNPFEKVPEQKSIIDRTLVKQDNSNIQPLVTHPQSMTSELSRPSDIYPLNTKPSTISPKKPANLSLEATKTISYTPNEKKTSEYNIAKPMQKSQGTNTENIKPSQTLNDLVKNETVSYGSPPQTNKVDEHPKVASLTPFRIDNKGKSITIRCDLHPSEYIEKICTDPKYPKKRLLCWECGVDETKEMQKYRVSTHHITQYTLQKLQEYSEANQQVKIPEEYINSYRTLKSTQEKFSENIVDNVSILKESLRQMKTELISRFDDIEIMVDEVSTEKVNNFGNNTQFFEGTLKKYYSNDQKQSVPHNELIDHLTAIETENEYENFIESLKAETRSTPPEVKSYLKALAYKANDLSKQITLPQKSVFKELKSKNLKISQLQEQLLINLNSIKSTVHELLDSSYVIDNISKTRVTVSNTLSADNMNLIYPLNKISDELMRYRLRFEKKFYEPNSRNINCISVIDNQIIAAGTLEQTITLWNIENGEHLESILAHDDVISGIYPYKVSVSDLKERKPHARSLQEDFTTLLISTGGKFDSNILFWDISWTYDYINGRITEKQKSKVVRRLEGYKIGVTSILPILDGVTLINGTYDGRICVWNVLKNRLGGEIKQHQSVVSSLKMMQCHQRFASASWDKTICIWKVLYKQAYDPETKIQSDRSIFEGFELEKVIDPSFKVLCLGSSFVNKNWLAFGGCMNRLVIWDVEAGKLVKEFECDNNNLVEMVLIEDQNSDKMVLFGVCDDDDVIRAWDTNYKESDDLLDEAYNFKDHDKIYVNKITAHGPVLQLVQDGVNKIATINCSKKQNCISLLEIQLGV